MHSRSIPVHAVEDTRRQVGECQRLRDLTRELMEVSDTICQIRLRTDTGAPTAQKGVQTQVTAEIAVEVERLIGASSLDDLDFEAIETAARQMALRVAGQAVAQRLNADHSDEQGPRLPCSCGAEARYAGRRSRTVTTALDSMTLDHAWYHCERCAEGFAPRDRALELDRSSLSPTALRMTGITAARLSFADASELLAELAGLDIDPKVVERQAEALGRAIAEDERQVVEPEPSEVHTLYLGPDGTGVPVRKTETQGRKGKQPDGAAKTREAKLAVVWSADSRDQDGNPARDPDSVSYNAAIETAAIHDTDTERPPFANRVLRDRGHPPRQRTPLRRRQGHLWTRNRSRRRRGKAAPRRTRPGPFRRPPQRPKGARRLLRRSQKTLDYFTNNRIKMRYPAFREQDLCVSTGVLEGGCKPVIAVRLKNGGMHWSVDGANAVIALRCAIRSNRFDDFCERRAAR